MVYSLSIWMSGASTSLKKRDTLQDRAAHLMTSQPQLNPPLTHSSSGLYILQHGLQLVIKTTQTGPSKSTTLINLNDKGSKSMVTPPLGNFPSSHALVLTWKYLAVPSFTLSQNPGTPFLPTLWVSPHLKNCNS